MDTNCGENDGNDISYDAVQAWVEQRREPDVLWRFDWWREDGADWVRVFHGSAGDTQFPHGDVEALVGQFGFRRSESSTTTELDEAYQAVDGVAVAYGRKARFPTSKVISVVNGVVGATGAFERSPDATIPASVVLSGGVGDYELPLATRVLLVVSTLRKLQRKATRERLLAIFTTSPTRAGATVTRQEVVEAVEDLCRRRALDVVGDGLEFELGSL